MAITDKEKGVWGLDQVYNKINQGSIWSYSAPRKLFALGRDFRGALGLNTQTAGQDGRSSPTQVPGTTWSAIATRGSGGNDYVSLATKTDGTLWTWGHNEKGQLGLNNRTSLSSPTQIGAGTDWAKDQKSISNGANSLAIKTDGTLYSWGYGLQGTLAQNDNIQRSSPTQIPGTTWSRVAGGTRRGAFGIKTDNSLWAWGSNTVGALGQNNRTNYSSPIQIPGDWATIASGGPSGIQLATKTDGTLWAWGPNEYGQIGQNDQNVHKSSPSQVPGTTWDTGDSKMAITHSASIAIKTDGTLWAWGENVYGILGQDDAVYRSSPTQIPGTTWNIVAATDTSAYAIKTDGTLWAWGNNQNGRLGQNYDQPSSSPKQIPGTNWVLIGSSADTVHFISED